MLISTPWSFGLTQGTGARKCSEGSLKVLVPSTRVCAIDSGTGMSFKRETSVASVRMTSSSCEREEERREM